MSRMFCALGMSSYGMRYVMPRQKLWATVEQRGEARSGGRAGGAGRIQQEDGAGRGGQEEYVDGRNA